MDLATDMNGERLFESSQITGDLCHVLRDIRIERGHSKKLKFL